MTERATGADLPSVVRSAWSDESFQEKDSDGFYIIAAAVIEPTAMESARESMRRLRGDRVTPKAHWTEMDRREREHAAQAVADIGGLHVVAVGSPVPARRQERARGKCLTELIVQLHGFDVGHLFMEARQAVLNRRDVETVQHTRRYWLPQGTRFRVEHVAGSSEPLLWVADVVAGACRAERLGEGMYREALGDAVLDFEVGTDC
ncbi:hypothetical protein [Spirillospora albida]|uniref:hypothetical protein n=1 Tax=Spirillospora albida TaxID=58123 RepID=UPI0004C0F3F2|nr:hypothetical protein [Spirillospora albida]